MKYLVITLILSATICLLGCQHFPVGDVEICWKGVGIGCKYLH